MFGEKWFVDMMLLRTSISSVANASKQQHYHMGTLKPNK